MFSLIYACTNGWANKRNADDLRRHGAHYDVTVMNQKQLETVDQWSTRIPPPSKRVSRGNAWIVIEHRSKSLCFYLPIHTGNVPLKFGFNVQSQTEVRVWKLKNPIWLPGGHLEVTLLKIDRLLPMYTINLLLKFRLNIQSQTEVRILKLKNSIWPPGSHFECDIVENQHVSFHTHK